MIIRSILIALFAGLAVTACVKSEVNVADDDDSNDDGGLDGGTDSETESTGSTDGDSDADSETDDSETGSGTGSDGDSDSESDSESETSTGSSCGLNVNETFAVNLTPPGWLVEDGDGDAYTSWAWSSGPNDIGNGAVGGLFQSAVVSPAGLVVDRLMTAEYTRGTCTTVNLSFKYRLTPAASGTAKVELQKDGGTWSEIGSYTLNDAAPVSINVSTQVATATKFRFRFVNNAPGTQTWKIDDVKVVGSAD